MKMKICFTLTRVTLAAVATASTACVPASDDSSETATLARGRVPKELPPPAGPGSGEPNLFLAGDEIILSWLEPVGDDHALRFARLVGDEWSPPVTVVRRPDLFVNWADFPSVVVLPDGTLAAHWLQYSGPGTYSYDVVVATSTDGGATWGEPSRPHSDGTPTEHGFVSLFASPDTEALTAVWLDGRAYADSASDRPFMSLRAASMGAEGLWTDRHVLDDRTCDCCQTSAVRTDGGVVVAYRGRTESEIRDIRVVRYEKGRWSEPATVHDDGWEIPACPVNGPSLAARGDTVGVAWFTAAGDETRVSLAFSFDGGRTFGSPLTVDRDRPLGRVSVSLTEAGAVVTWLAVLEFGSGVLARSVFHDGRGMPPLLLGPAEAERSSGFPVSIRRGQDLVAAWTEPGERSTIRVVTVRMFGSTAPNHPPPERDP